MSLIELTLFKTKQDILAEHLRYARGALTPAKEQLKGRRVMNGTWAGERRISTEVLCPSSVPGYDPVDSEICSLYILSEDELTPGKQKKDVPVIIEDISNIGALKQSGAFNQLLCEGIRNEDP